MRLGTSPPAVFLVAIVSMMVLHWALPLGVVVAGQGRLLGLAPLVAGIWLNRAAHDLFRRHGTTVDPFGEPSVLVAAGVFGYTRNPMYLGGVLILLGLAVCFGSATPFLVAPAFAGLVTVRFIRLEEASLARRFGADYQAYRRKVRRWI